MARWRVPYAVAPMPQPEQPEEEYKKLYAYIDIEVYLFL